ncbi:TetR/AcrR family transcriptional regulator [Cryobacterium levicorallinum]|uniref:TetR/AcrR family transcriptional regulator n=1 Tax=Cryobacterium levicorallinum TaxID=995038 RepID=UPI00141BD73E|nr:hypothetical protein [Cryobacterium levicorallinum]
MAGGPHAQALSSYLQYTVFETLTAEFGQERARRIATALIGVIFSRYVLTLPSMTAMPAALWVADPNPCAQTFYRKHGFFADGAVKTDDGVRELRRVRAINAADTR